LAGTFILPAGGFEKFIFLIERGYPRSIKKPLPKAEGVVKISDLYFSNITIKPSNSLFSF
jgi:hypothetical protein